MKVGITEECGRCGRKTGREVEWEDATAIHEQRVTDEKCREELTRNVLSALAASPTCAEVVVGVRQADGSFQVTVLNDLCVGAADAVRTTGCADRVKSLLADIFMTAPKPLKVKKPKHVKDDTETTENSDGSVEPSDDTVADVGVSSSKKKRK